MNCAIIKNIFILYLINLILLYELNNKTCKMGPCWTAGTIVKNKGGIYSIMFLICLNFVVGLSYIIYSTINYLYYRNINEENNIIKNL